MLLAFVLPAILLTLGFMDFSVMLERFSTISTGGEYSSVHRAEALVVGMQIFQDNWLIGTGVDTFPLYFAIESHSGVEQAAHNMYLTTLVETGIFGGLASAVVLCVLGWLLISTVKKSWNTANEGLALGLTSLTLAWALSGLFGGFYSETIVFFYFGILLALRQKVCFPAVEAPVIRDKKLADLAV